MKKRLEVTKMCFYLCLASLSKEMAEKGFGGTTKRKKIKSTGNCGEPDRNVLNGYGTYINIIIIIMMMMIIKKVNWKT